MLSEIKKNHKKSSENEEVGIEELRKGGCCTVSAKADYIVVTCRYVPENTAESDGTSVREW